MRVCFVASEVAPFAKTGGLADVAGALPKYLSRRDCEVRVFMPFYGSIDRSSADVVPVDYLRDVQIRFGRHTTTVSIWTTRLPESDVEVYLIESPSYFDRGAIYTEHDDEYLRFFLLQQATLVCCQHMGWAPEIIHCNDWQTSLIPLMLRTSFHWDQLFRQTRTVLTIHNIAYQGVFPSHVLEDVGLAGYRHLFFQEDLDAGVINYLKSGLLYADMITTVSRTYAQEIRTPEMGAGLDALLRRRGGAVVGIVNGVDYEEWNPAHDRFVPFPFDLHDLDGKELTKEHLLHRLELPYSPNVPLMGIVSRLTEQKGFELVMEVMDPILRHYDVQLAVLGSGSKEYESYFAGLERRHPKKVVFYRGFSNELAHLIEAGADMFLMPSRFEPCGLNQIYSLRYGTLPIVRRTGGLADTVEQLEPASGSGTGFVFEHFDAQGLAWGIETAIKTWYLDRGAWQRGMRNAMSRDFSWEHQVGEYLEVYRRAFR